MWGTRRENHGRNKSIRVQMKKTWAASYPLLTQKAFLLLIGWILLLMKGQIHNVEHQSSWYCHFVPVLKCFKINMGCMTKKTRSE